MALVALSGVVALVGVACVRSSGMGDTSMKPGSHSMYCVDWVGSFLMVGGAEGALDRFSGVCFCAALTLGDLRVIFCAPACLARSLGVVAPGFSATAGLVFGVT